MRKRILIIALAMCMVGASGAVFAQTTDDISVTVSLESAISVSVSPPNWNIGPIALSASNGPASFSATVGNMATRLDILATDGANGWTLGATIGTDQFVVAVASPALTLTTVYQLLSASVAAYASQGFDLTYSAPSGDTQGGGVDHSCTVTVRASAP